MAGEHEFYAAGVLVHNTSWVPRRPTTKIPSPDRLDALVHAMHSVAKIVEPASVASPTELRSILSSGHNGLRGATLRQLGVVNQ